MGYCFVAILVLSSICWGLAAPGMSDRGGMVKGVMDMRTDLFGRKVIMHDADAVTADNVLTVLADVWPTYMENSSQIKYLHKYYRGRQPILDRVKDIRPEICNRLVVNLANEIVCFARGYIAGEPIQYVLRGEEGSADSVTRLNEMMFTEQKFSRDMDLITDMLVCGTGYRLVLPDRQEDANDAPFEIYGLDPAKTFVIYSSKFHHKPLAAVYVVRRRADRQLVATVYTPTQMFTVEDAGLGGGRITGVDGHALGRIPIIEYPAGRERMGYFECVIPLLDCINNIQSNRADGIEQYIQSLMKFKNCDVDTDILDEIRQLGAVKIKSSNGLDADVELMSQELNQQQTQTLIDNLMQLALTICGIPTIGNGKSDSSNNGAVVLKNGWQSAEARAKGIETAFKESETEFLKQVLNICATKGALALPVSSVDIRFTRRNYEDIQSKSQVLLGLLNNDKVHPLEAYKACDMFPDPEQAYENGMAWREQLLKEEDERLNEAIDVRNFRQGDSNSEQED